LEVEKARFQGVELRAKQLVGGGEAVRPEGGEAGEEDVIGDLKARGGESEDVLRGVEEGESFDEAGECGDEEDCEGAGDFGRDGHDRDAVYARCSAGGTVVLYGFWEEHGPEEEEQ